jgi:hypothetical protein
MLQKLTDCPAALPFLQPVSWDRFTWCVKERFTDHA